MKKNLLLPFLALAATVFLFSFREKKPHVLIFFKTSGYYHNSIPEGIAAIRQLGEQNGFTCDTTTDSLQFNKRTLKKYAAVIFLNTTGNVLGDEQQKMMEQFIRSGRGYVGVHAATDTEYDWPWYNQLVGAYFKSHPKQQQAIVLPAHAALKGMPSLPAKWSRWDEWYNFKSTHWNKVNVLLTLDEKSIEGADNAGYHPIAWYREFDGGRSFYTAMGHTKESYADPLFLNHLLAGIKYAIGK
ncbi:MAG: ThuA domain-containing protein [Sphingobacteriales bacterium]|nr:MAG: ThuA domain-containing protein [Sphingobacteriales bacterium]